MANKKTTSKKTTNKKTGTRTEAQMRCHQCKRRRSKGPRFHYLCDKCLNIDAEVKKQQKRGAKKKGK